MYTALIFSSLVALVAGQTACSTATQTCTSSLKNPAPGGTICGGKGNVSSPTYAIPLCQYTSLDNCRTLCLSNANCLAYSWDSANGACGVYSKIIGQMGYVANSASTKTFYAKGCYNYSCTNPSSGGGQKNLGFSVEFGQLYDPSTNNNINGVSSAVVVSNSNYCGGPTCKQIVFTPSTGGNHQSIISTIPINNISGNTRLIVNASLRTLYQASTCSSTHYVRLYNADGSVRDLRFQNEAQTIPWGSYGRNQFIIEDATTVNKIDVFIQIGCGSTTESTKPPTVFLDGWNLSVA